MGQAIRSGNFGIPPPAKLPLTEKLLPRVILGDEAFAINENLMKPYPRNQSLVDESIAIYNYRHSRARRIVENAFGHLANTFRIFHQPIPVSPDVVDLIALTACILHNMLCRFRLDSIDEHIFLDTGARNLIPIEESSTRNSAQNVYAIRDEFKNYFNGVGAVEWQWKHGELS